MGRSLTRITKPITRVIGDNLVVTIDAEGVELRGLRKRVLRKHVTWEQIAALDDDPNSICRECEIESGKKELGFLGIELVSED